MLKSIELTVKHYCQIYLSGHLEIINNSLSLDTVVRLLIPLNEYESVFQKFELITAEEEFYII